MDIDLPLIAITMHLRGGSLDGTVWKVDARYPPLRVQLTEPRSGGMANSGEMKLILGEGYSTQTYVLSECPQTKTDAAGLISEMVAQYDLSPPAKLYGDWPGFDPATKS